MHDTFSMFKNNQLKFFTFFIEVCINFENSDSSQPFEDEAKTLHKTQFVQCSKHFLSRL